MSCCIGQWWRTHDEDDLSRRDAQCFLCSVLGCTQTQLFLRQDEPLSAAQEQHLTRLWSQRQAAVPMAYILGCVWFWGLSLKVSSDVLIPRPDTEVLVQVALQLPLSAQAQIADLGTGSGAVALALAHERKYWQIWATDISLKALTVAEENARSLHLHNVNFRQGDWIQAVAGQKFALVLSNPPYIASNDPHLLQLQAEPQQALVSGEKGLNDLSTLIACVPEVMGMGGWILLEHGGQQGESVRQLLVGRGWQNVYTHLDLAGRERVTQGCWHG